MSERLAILINTATPDRADLVKTPLVHALAARAMDIEVEIHFAGPAVRWLLPAVAASREIPGNVEKPVADYLAELLDTETRLVACSMAVAAYVGPDEILMPAVKRAGATAFVFRAMSPEWRTLVY